VLTEAIKQRFNRGLKSNLYFWRDVQGHEVDILIDNAGILTPVEVKSGQTISNDYFEGLKTWRGISKRSSSADSLIYAGERNYMDNGIHVQGWETVRWPIGE
jgi:predicted AAA+ superfamily ATPase